MVGKVGLTVQGSNGQKLQCKKLQCKNKQTIETNYAKPFSYKVTANAHCESDISQRKQNGNIKKKRKRKQTEGC